METLIRIDNLHKSFYDGDTELKVLKGVNLDVHQAEVLAIMGASGVGKSTLLHIIGTLDRPTEGNIFYEDEDVTTFSERELTRFRNDAIGFVFQFHQLLPEFTALENVAMSGLIRNTRKVADENGNRYSSSKAYEKAEILLESVGLSERLGHFPSQLSGGERQRVAIARALINQPKVVLADEPTGNIDDKTSGAVLDVLQDINERLKQTFIIVTHDSRLSERANRTVHLVDGKIADE
ncbi:MAG: ABC transporter ATP-binding protein [Candidatus Poribacteria bacterium]|nr:ABC transporter ATP-binding protein [Candidatus Poribacteria bacterium]